MLNATKNALGSPRSSPAYEGKKFCNERRR
jgi:hypothetical protein